MIYARTGMDGMPEKCRDCDYCQIGFAANVSDSFCAAISGGLDLETIHSKPNWCPLVDIPAEQTQTS